MTNLSHCDPAFPKISQAPPAQTTAAQVAILGNLPEPLLVDMMAVQAKIQNMGWLRTMVEGGLLDVEDELRTVTTKKDMEELIEVWADRSKALMSFMQNITFQLLDKDPATGLMASPLAIAVHGSTQESKDFYAQSAIRMIKSHDQLRGHNAFGQMALNHEKTVQAMSIWVAGACVMDLPSTVSLLVKNCPKSMFHLLDIKIMGNQFMENTALRTEQDNDPYEIQVQPMFVALQLSRIECMNALHNAGHRGNLEIGMKKTFNREISFSAMNLYASCAPVCTPQAMHYAISMAMKVESSMHLEKRIKDSQHKLAMDILEPKEAAMRPYVSAYIDAGIYDFKPIDSVMQALIHGHANVIDHFRGRMPWETMQEDFESFSPIYEAATNSQNHVRADYENAIFSLMDQAESDVKAGYVFKTTGGVTAESGADQNQVQPLAALTNNGLTRVIVKYLENGLDTHTAPTAGGLSVQAYADKNAPEIGHLMRTFEARKKTRELLSDFDAQAKQSKEKP